ncbi:MAG: hypothetical protein JWM05_115 [Acidimicrobiales bacterium]|nr:hypothetical protein [Acidimicrobiales bacterium]
MRSTRRALVLALAAITAAVEVASLLDITPLIRVGGLPLSTSIVPAAVLAVACGGRLFGRSRARRAAVSYWLAAALTLLALTIAYLRIHRGMAVPALVIAAFDEEIVYRLAIPAVLAAMFRAVRVPYRGARIAALVMAGLWFVALPGHRDQVTSPAALVPFIAFAGLSALLVYRSGSILPMAIGHAIANCLTILMWHDAVPPDARSAILASVLVLLVVAYGRPRHIAHGDDGGLMDVRTGLMVDTIDLRGGHGATATLSDGQVISLGTDAARRATF